MKNKEICPQHELLKLSFTLFEKSALMKCAGNKYLTDMILFELFLIKVWYPRYVAASTRLIGYNHIDHKLAESKVQSSVFTILCALNLYTIHYAPNIENFSDIMLGIEPITKHKSKATMDNSKIYIVNPTQHLTIETGGHITNQLCIQTDVIGPIPGDSGNGTKKEILKNVVDPSFASVEQWVSSIRDNSHDN